MAKPNEVQRKGMEMLMKSIAGSRRKRVNMGGHRKLKSLKDQVSWKKEMAEEKKRILGGT